jgi:alginate O-acetyltransferase complex protein AlgI
MLFNSHEFLFLFLPLTLLGFYILRAAVSVRASFGWLLAASAFFYAYWSPVYLALLCASMAFNYWVAGVLMRTRQVKVLYFGIAVDLLTLGYFKYTNFLLETYTTVTGITTSHYDIILPLGISFFIFQKIAYLVDAKKGVVFDRDPLRYSLFVLFFPQLIAGPIVHYSTIIPQLADFERGLKIRPSMIGTGIFLFSIGLFKKVVIADYLERSVSPVFAVPSAQGLWEAWTGALSYTFQLYFDFSGYSDMAIGLAMLFGICLPKNFNQPYLANNLIDFWRRWHITLGAFLRDYVYIPLGGNRSGLLVMAGATMITMAIAGLWHGAGLTFIIWGIAHGAGLVINRMWQRTGVVLPAQLSRFFTFLFVVLAWVVFRAASIDDACHIYKAMLGLNGIYFPPWLDLGVQVRKMAGLSGVELPITLAILYVIWRYRVVVEFKSQLAADAKYQIATVLFFVFSLFSLGSASTFLYFQF